MKFAGKSLNKLTEDIYIIFREDPETHEEVQQVFLVKETRREEFDRIYPEPVPPTKTTPRGEIQNFKDAGYLMEVERRNKAYQNWIFIESIKDTEGLEWEDVNTNDPNTWDKAEAELKTVLRDFEYVQLMTTILKVHGLDNNKLDEAKKSFLAGKGKAQ